MLQSNTIMKKKKILFCYFSPLGIPYTPTDIGYIVAILQQEVPAFYDFEIIQLHYETTKNEDATWTLKQEKYIERDIELILYHKPDAVFFFTENVLWSKVFTLLRATKIMKILRQKKSSIFLGLQSYKIQNEQTREILDNGYTDAVIKGDPEKIFIHLSELLEKKFIPGTEYKNNVVPRSGLIQMMEDFGGASCDNNDSLDHIPSPYLSHVFDNYIQTQQRQTNNTFRAFLLSARGCGFKCYYCFRSTKFDKVRCFSVKRFYNEVEYLFNNFKVRNFFVLDDAFLYSRERLQEFEDEFNRRLVTNPTLKCIDVFVMARPETVDEKIIQTLANINVTCIQFGLQTVNPDLQHYMGRKIDTLYFKKIKDWLRTYNIKLYLDIVIGLPGDSPAWVKETMRFALLLDPAYIQIKQFYLNPDTLFQVNQSEYEIKIEKEMRDFDTLYVDTAKNIDEKYFTETNEFIMKQIKDNPQILWKYLTKRENYISPNWSLRRDTLEQKENRQEREEKSQTINYYNELWSLKNISTKKPPQATVPVIDTTKIYLWSDTKNLVAINQLDGSIVWGFKLNAINKKTTPSPLLVENNKLYFGACDNNIYCLDTETGKVLWVAFEANWTGSPLILAQNLNLIFSEVELGIIKKRKALVALDTKTGKIAWQKDLKNTISSLSYNQEEDTLVIYTSSGTTQSYSPMSGEILSPHENKNYPSNSQTLEIDTDTKNIMSCLPSNEQMHSLTYNLLSRRFFVTTNSGNIYCLSQQTIVHLFSPLKM